MKKNLMFLAVAAIGLASCNSGLKKGEGGMLYSIHEDKDGPTVKEGDFVAVNLIAKNDADSVLINTYDNGQPSPSLMPKPQYKGDIYSGIAMLSEGDSATIKISADTMFKHMGQRPPNFKGKYVIYEVKVAKVIPKGKLSEQVFQGRVSDYFNTIKANMVKSEPGKMQKYAADKGLKLSKTASGLMYQITKEGSGPKIMPGDSAVINYTGQLLTGKVFDSSNKEVAQKNKIFNPMRPYAPIHIAIGAGAVIPGWEEGVQLLNKGAKATLVIPSKLAYGERGAPNVIPPFSPIVFDVELVDIIHANPNAPKPVAPQLPQAAPQK
jgi:FKBP-type peptidyl-prolyl cis-trans isomerase FkpA